jgi:CheY-like chemotaxis protein
MPAGGNLTLSAENFDVDEHYASMIPGAKAGPHVLLRVTDTGTGIPRNVIDKIFDPFFTTKEIGVGTGLGLSTVLGIVKSHGGFMNVYSEPGHTSFSLFLPALGEEISSAPPHETELPTGRGETILFVDDEPGIRVIAKALLENNGYQVLIAEDGPSALALFAREWSTIQLVLTDMAMPFMSGMSLARTLRRMNPEVRIIISTGREEECRATEIEELQVQACLAKPFTRKKLLETIEQVFSEAAPVLHE